MNEFLAPIIDRRKNYENNIGRVREILTGRGN